MTTALTVHNASITTATVSIDTLTISGKQVTLAVFRQLRVDQRLINDAGEFMGVPWGTVNYHQKSCERQHPDHEHVVWQVGEDLRQCVAEPPSWPTQFWSEYGDRLVFAAGTLEEEVVYSNVGPEWIWKPPRWGSIFERGATFEYRFEIDSSRGRFRCIADLPGRLHHSVSSSGDRFVRLESADDVEAHRGADQEALLIHLRREIREEISHRRRHEARWREIKALPQLFIAV